MNFNNIIFRLFILSVFFVSCNSKDKKDTKIKVNLDSLQSGDIVLKRGKGMVSNFIVSLLKEQIPISHCGIISKSMDSTYIIHTVANELSAKDGMQTISFNDFEKDCEKNSLYVIRYKSSKEICAKIEQIAQFYLNEKTPFDYKFDIVDKKEIYCSELVYHVLIDCFQKNYFKIQKIQSNDVLLFNSLINDTINFRHIYSGI